jgi:hypothetical protein
LLHEGKVIDNLPPDMRLYVSNKKRADSLGNAFSWHILSERAITTLRQFVPETDLQVLGVPIFDAANEQRVEGYFLANCLRVIAALAAPVGSKPIYAHKVVIKDSCVLPDTHLFHLQEAARYWIVSDVLWKSLLGFDGLSVIPVQTV